MIKECIYCKTNLENMACTSTGGHKFFYKYDTNEQIPTFVQTKDCVELKKEQILRLAEFAFTEYNYQMFPEEPREVVFYNLSEKRKEAWKNVAKLIIEDFKF